MRFGMVRAKLQYILPLFFIIVITQPNTLRNYLSLLGLEQYYDLFEAEDITFDILTQMTNADLQSIGISIFGHRFWIRTGITNWTPDKLEYFIAPQEQEVQQ